MNDTVRQQVINEYIQKDPFAAHLEAKIELLRICSIPQLFYLFRSRKIFKIL